MVCVDNVNYIMSNKLPGCNWLILSVYDIQCNSRFMVYLLDVLIYSEKNVTFTFVDVFWCAKTLSFDHEYSWFRSIFIYYILVNNNAISFSHEYSCILLFSDVLKYYVISLIVNIHVLILFFLFSHCVLSNNDVIYTLY